MVLTVLGAGIVLWFHQERSDLLAIQEQQTLQNEADQVVVSSQAYEMIMVEVTGNLRDYFTLVEELNGDSPELQIEPKQLNKQNNQLHIQFDIIS